MHPPNPHHPNPLLLGCRFTNVPLRKQSGVEQSHNGPYYLQLKDTHKGNHWTDIWMKMLVTSGVKKDQKRQSCRQSVPQHAAVHHCCRRAAAPGPRAGRHSGLHLPRPLSRASRADLDWHAGWPLRRASEGRGAGTRRPRGQHLAQQPGESGERGGGLAVRGRHGQRTVSAGWRVGSPEDHPRVTCPRHPRRPGHHWQSVERTEKPRHAGRWRQRDVRFAAGSEESVFRATRWGARSGGLLGPPGGTARFVPSRRRQFWWCFVRSYHLRNHGVLKISSHYARQLHQNLLEH